MHPKCINASNPFHECVEYCFRRIAEAVNQNKTDASGFSFSNKVLIEKKKGTNFGFFEGFADTYILLIVYDQMFKLASLIFVGGFFF